MLIFEKSVPKAKKSSEEVKIQPYIGDQQFKRDVEKL